MTVTYSPGRLVYYLNGEKVTETADVQGDFSNWSSQHLLFGDEWDGARAWRGTLEGVALYAREFDVEQVRRSYEEYQSVTHGQQVVQRIEVEATLVARSDVPTLENIAPYRDALIMEEYAVQAVISGALEETRIRVVRWAILGRKELDLQPAGTALAVRLGLESLTDNPQLDSVYLSDTLDYDLDVPLFYAVR